MLEEKTQARKETIPRDTNLISWWSWRPGIQPRNALLIGGAFSLIALLLLALGLVVLGLSIADTISSPLSVPGTVTRHTITGLNSTYYLAIQLHEQGFPASISVAVNKEVYQAIRAGEAVSLEYSSHLQVLNALDAGGQRYILPNSGEPGIVLGAIALLLLGLALLPYPAALARWGWRDLYIGGRVRTSGTIIALRAATETQMRRPGLMPRRGVRTWYGVALSSNDTENILTFAVNETMFRGLVEGVTVTITSSPCIHYVYSLEQAREGE